MPRRARPWHALSVSATLNPCHRPRKGIDTVAFERQPHVWCSCPPYLHQVSGMSLKGLGSGSGSRHTPILLGCSRYLQYMHVLPCT